MYSSVILMFPGSCFDHQNNCEIQVYNYIVIVIILLAIAIYHNYILLPALLFAQINVPCESIKLFYCDYIRT